VTYTAKRSESKTTISRLAYNHNIENDCVYNDIKGNHLYHSVSLGVLYDRTVLGRLDSEHSTDITDLFLQKITESKQVGEEQENNSKLEKQASMYLSMIEDIMSSSETDFSVLIPAFSALKACISNGWKPSKLTKVRENKDPNHLIFI
jgi:hypothetical protein